MEFLIFTHLPAGKAGNAQNGRSHAGDSHWLLFLESAESVFDAGSVD
jgi:hypothetical protein